MYYIYDSFYQYRIWSNVSSKHSEINNQNLQVANQEVIDYKVIYISVICQFDLNKCPCPFTPLGLLLQ